MADELNNQSEEQKEINEIEEKEYLAKIRAKNKKFLIKLSYDERKRIAKHIKGLYNDVKESHDELSDDLDKYDNVYRMVPGVHKTSEVSSDAPNYTTDLSTVMLEVIHSNIMNVLFSPKNIVRVLPTEQNDIPKVAKLDIFANWSVENELNIFEKCDRLFHNSNKNGMTPYIMYWSKEYGTEIKTEIVKNPANPQEPLIDEDTKEPITQEKEISKLLYNGPKLEVFSLKDYYYPKNSTLDKQLDWEMRKIRLNADKVNRNCLEGKYYDTAYEDIGKWGIEEGSPDENKTDKEGEAIPLGKSEKLFMEFYGKLRIKAIKADKENEEESYEELEDEFIAIIELNSETLCQLRKNKFPLKMRPIGIDRCLPDDEGRFEGVGIIEFMDGPQNAYDNLFNQYLFATIQSNDPFGFFAPTGNMKDERIKVQHGYLYPTSDPNSINIVKLPPPDNSLRVMMEEVRNQAQLLFGISDYSAGIESQIDPTAPAKKAEIVLQQGNVRLNLIIKRKNQTLKDIFKRWFLLYQANMPLNKFMRITGETENEWQFLSINMTDFALNSIPDFQLTGNILNANKALEINKKIGVYQMLVGNFFFNPQTIQGQQALHALTKWLLDNLDEMGISNFLPKVEGEETMTPQEENARFMQGDTGVPTEKEDHMYHLNEHRQFLSTPELSNEIRKNVIDHITAHIELLRKLMIRQTIAAQQPPIVPVRQGAEIGQAGQNIPGNVLPSFTGMGGT